MSGSIAAALLMPLAAGAQQPGKPARIGVIAPGSPPLPHFEALRQGLRDLGYVEGQAIVFETRWDEGRQDRYLSLVGDLVHLKIDIIVAGSTQSAIAAKTTTQTIPIVMTANADPVRAGLVTSLARPGGNVTGMSLIATELSSKRIEILKTVVPGLARVGVLWNPENPISGPLLRETQAAGRVLAVQAQALEVRNPADFDGTFRAAVRGGAQALLIVQDAMFTLQRWRIAELALKSSFPTMSGETGFAAAGGLMNYGTNIVDSWRRSAVYVDRILRGANSGDLPIEQPTKFELVINLRTAKALGLTIPQSLLLLADQVIE